MNRVQQVTKCQVLKENFEFNNHVNKVETWLKNLLTHMSGHRPTILLDHESFQFNNIEVATEQGQPVTFNPQAAALMVAQGKSIPVIMLHLETDVQAAYHANEEEAMEAKLSNAHCTHNFWVLHQVCSGT